ncbi:MAG: hypothetical protein RJA98_2582 [Pseudomonadota bacterium]|jgi:hypothetical protein
MRRAMRTFRMDRVLEAVDLETGEVLPDIRAWLADKSMNGVEAAAQTLMDKHHGLLAILLYVGRADGRFTKAEKLVVADLAREITGDSRLDDQFITELVSEIDLPTIPGFQRAVKQMARQAPEYRARVILAAERIVATQKTASAEEQGALDFMRAAFTQS